MQNRRGEKIGWTAGWIGGFLWVAVFAVLFFYQGRYGQSIQGVAITAVAILAIVYFSPWRFPSTPYWKLMLVPYAMFWLSIIWCVWSYGGLATVGLDWWNFLWLVPCMIPLGVLSRRKWKDSERQSSPDANSS